MKTFKTGATLDSPSAIAPRFDAKGVAAPPAAFDFDDGRPGIQTSEFLNDQYGDCVLAARAHHTLRLRYDPNQHISDDEVLRQYFLEARCKKILRWWKCSGISVESSLQAWRDSGWTAATIPNRKIASYAVVDYTNEDNLKAALYTMSGVQFTLSLPEGLSSQDACGPNHPWDRTDLKRGSGHAILLHGYDAYGAIGVTWGVKQWMSWAFINKYGTGAFVVTPDAST